MTRTWGKWLQAWNNFYLRTPYQIRRSPLSLFACAAWFMLGVELWVRPFPHYLYPAVIDLNSRSNAYYFFAGALMITGLLMLAGSVGAWTSRKSAKLWWTATVFATLEAAVMFVICLTTLFFNTYLFPEIIFAVIIWGIIFLWLLLTCFTVKHVIFDGGRRYE